MIKMMLKVICQKCKAVGEIDTLQPINEHSWEGQVVTELIYGLDENLDYEVWFCGECSHWINHMYENISDDALDEFYRNIFKPKESEFESSSG